MEFLRRARRLDERTGAHHVGAFAAILLGPWAILVGAVIVIGTGVLLWSGDDIHWGNFAFAVAACTFFAWLFRPSAGRDEGGN